MAEKGFDELINMVQWNGENWEERFSIEIESDENRSNVIIYELIGWRKTILFGLFKTLNLGVGGQSTILIWEKWMAKGTEGVNGGSIWSIYHNMLLLIHVLCCNVPIFSTALSRDS